jgi:hypothetical protein
MGYLFLDTRQSGSSWLCWQDGQGESMWVQDGRAQDTLAAIRHHLPEIRTALKGVVVVAGPGRFSSIRVGILYANILARWFKVPIFSASPEQVQDDQSRQIFVHSIASGAQNASEYVAPVYDREPNITLPKL